MSIHLTTLQCRAHNTQRAWESRSERRWLMRVKGRGAAACLFLRNADRTLVHAASCSARAWAMPVMKLIL